jgi:hypothetical protein
MNKNNLDNARQLLSEIGSRFSDVFGVDGVVWAGPTEVECFPLLLNADRKRLPSNTTIARLANVDDLQGRHAEIIAEAYRNLSSAGSLLPPNVVVTLDGDKVKSRAAELLRRAYGDIICFLPCRNYESYLISPSALSWLLNSLPSFKDTQISCEVISDWIVANGRHPRYKCPEHEPFSSEWIHSVDGARLLEDLFERVSKYQETYLKPRYSVELTRWLLDNDLESLRELIDYAVSILPIAR